ncbi:Choline/ethanolamine kinase family protein [Theileria parva strain Muguga]|uniref:Choline kinase, putative n=1 Tax=Theileria parva TaxID=5875 RepID=Q4N4I2_THEPA|nr:Choline/ethanolamine kinase family protein [Theileria parva strain Muguga]EAN32941.1 Choline/ethanolamine kinase family protein [Theileria parva strain Muguga]|eukprot:XP_765224.1 choline kinase [Theileria parva strain Muguga]
MDQVTGVSEHSFQHNDQVKTSENEGYFLNETETNEVKTVSLKYVPLWNSLTDDKLELKIISCALTNRVYLVTLVKEDKDKYPYKKLIVKKRTDFNSLVVDNDVQFNIAKLLGDNNFGPKIIGRFGDFTIQNWVEGNTMEIECFQNLSVLTGIASSLAKFHKRVTELVPKDWDRTPMFLTKLSVWSQHIERIIKKYNLDFDYNELVQNYELFKKIFNNHLNSSQSTTNSVLFCHNDLFSLNILDFNQGIYFIDFDFAGFNYVGWEIASFFVEVTILYDPPTPPYFISSKEYHLSEEKKSLFVSVYLSQLLGRNVLASDDVVREFLQSVEIHTSDKPKNELSKPVKLDAYGMFQYNLFKSNLRKLTDEKIVNF